MGIRDDSRSITIIVHVDHGKTALVDQLPHQSGTFRVNEAIAERVMDSNDLEHEHGITILFKDIAVMYDGTKINIVDIPDYADFGDEVERILTIMGGVLLLVDVPKGCISQTRFVLKEMPSLGKKPVIIVNKIDRPGARSLEIVDKVLDLFIGLGADESQPEFPVVCASGHDNCVTLDLDKPGENMVPLFESILKFVPTPQGDLEDPTQVLFSDINYDDYLGHTGVGRMKRGRVRDGQSMVLYGHENGNRNARIIKFYQSESLRRAGITEVVLGDIVAVSGITDLNIGEAACVPDCVEPLPSVKIDEPTVSMMFMVSNGPFANKGGEFVTSRNPRSRLFKEVEMNVALRMKKTDSAGTFRVSERGELHLPIPIEAMCRQNYEFQVPRSSVICKTIGGKRYEPIEFLMTEALDRYVGAVMGKLGSRKAEIVNVGTRESGMTHMEFRIPVHGLTGYHSEFLTDTNGNGIMNHVFNSYEPYRGDIIQRAQGSLVTYETSPPIAYGLFYAQDRGKLFTGANVEVCEGMTVGASPKQEDITVSTCKKKHVANTCASGSDDALRLTLHTVLSLERFLEFIAEDELVEVTPKSIRMRKTILNKEQRMRQSNRKR